MNKNYLIILLLSLILISGCEENIGGEAIEINSNLNNDINTNLNKQLKLEDISPIIYESNINNNFLVQDNLLSDKSKYNEGVLTVLSKEEDYNGYIIELRSEPLVIKDSKLKKQVENGKIDYSEKTVILDNYKNQLTQEHSNVKEDFRIIVPNMDSKIREEYTKVFNGFSLDISDEQASELQKKSYIKKVYKNYKVNVTLMDSVPLINADDVWQMQDEFGRNITGQNISIAIIDTGIDYTHPDLGGCFGVGCKVVGGYDFVNNDNNPMDDQGHGTHCAGIAAGNGVLKGVAPDSELYAYKVLNEEGSGYDDWIIAGIERAVDPNNDNDTSDHVDVISMSFGVHYSAFNDCYEIASSITSDNAVNAGVNVVVAAGNEGKYKSLRAPGCARNVITVGASDNQDNIAYFSSKGPTKDFRVKPDVIAPGVSICSAQWENAWASNQCLDNEHIAISGTSMATPHVAGASALIKQAHPEWTPDEIKYALRNTAIDIGEDILTQGYGRIDVLEAVQSSKAPIAFLNISVEAKGIINITGIALGENFSYYTLEYGEADTPDELILLINSTESVLNDVLGTFNTNIIQDGLYTIKLKVYSLNNYKSEENSFIIITNDDNNCYTDCDCKIKLEKNNSFVNLNNNLDLDSRTIYCLPFKIYSNNSTFNGNNNKINFNNGMYYNYGQGVFEIYGNNITIKNCFLNYSFSPIVLEASNYTSVINNTIINSAAGIQLGFDTYQSKIENNTIIDCAVYHFMVFGYESQDFNHTITSNIVNDKPLLYLFQESNQIITNQDTGELFCAWSNNLTIINNTLDGGDRILLYYTNNSNVKNNNIKNTNRGISLRYSNDNIIEENTILEGNSRNSAITRGITISQGENNVFSKNIIANYSINIDVRPTLNLTLVENNIFKTKQPYFNKPPFFSIILENPENSNIKYNIINGLLLQGNYESYNNTNIYNNIIKKTDTASHGNFSIYSEIYDLTNTLQLSYNNQGNFWNRMEEPYFCEYENQHPDCIYNWDSNNPDVIDSCPYNQSYPPGEWPASPVCTPIECSDGTVIGDCSITKPKYCNDNTQLIDNCQECGCFDEVCIDNGSCSGPCFDSDAGNNQLYIFGFAFGPNYNYSQLINKTDYCVGDVLRENTCTKSNIIGQIKYACENGCENGACISSNDIEYKKELEEDVKQSLIEEKPEEPIEEETKTEESAPTAEKENIEITKTNTTEQIKPKIENIGGKAYASDNNIFINFWQTIKNIFKIR